MSNSLMMPSGSKVKPTDFMMTAQGGESITASKEGWYFIAGFCAKFGGNYNPDWTYSTDGSNVQVISDRSEGNADGGYGDIAVGVYLKVGQSIRIWVTNGSGTYRSSFIAFCVPVK